MDKNKRQGGKRALGQTLGPWGRALRLCAALALFSGGMFLRDLARSSREREANHSLAIQLHQTMEDREDPDSRTGSFPVSEPLLADNGVLRPYADLWEQNQDLAGWLTIPGTAVNYPVMCTPEEPEYYLRRGFDGEHALSGSLFLGAGWVPDAAHGIIFGHCMKDGSMFGTLSAYADKDFWLEYPTFTFDTMTQPGEYQVMAAFYSRVYTDLDTDVFRYYQYTDLSQPDTFEDYVHQATAAALYDTGVCAQFGDQLLTLSTCSYHTRNGRFVVVAKKVG